MRKFLIIAATALAAAPALAEDVSGLWKSAPSDEGAYIHVRIGPCASDAQKVCGTIVETFNSTSDRDITGRLIIEDMVADGPNAWQDGTIWAPDDDKTYASEMELRGDVLEVSGCVLAGLICRGQEWTRVK